MNKIENYLLKQLRYYDHDTKYKGINDLRYLFDKDDEEDYYEPKLINTAFENNYFQYETTSEIKNMLPLDEYFKMVQSHLIQLINNHKNDNNRKIQLTMNVNFTPVEDLNDKRSLYINTKNFEIMLGSDTNEIVNELFDSIIQKYQELLDNATNDSGLVSEGVETTTYDINKTTINRSGSYIESPTWLKSKI